MEQVQQDHSPFELVYGWDVRGTLDAMKEDWIHNELKDNDIIIYVTRIYERLREGQEGVQDNFRESWLKQKKWYDKQARVHQPLPGTSNGKKVLQKQREFSARE